MRENARRREHERDEEDRRREQQEIEEEKRRQEEEERIRKESKILNREGEDGKIAVKTTKLNFNISIKRNTLGGVDEEEEEESKKKRRVLVPLDYSDIDNRQYSDDEEMTVEERTARLKKLIDSIPSSQNELWSYRVRWEELDEVSDIILKSCHLTCDTSLLSSKSYVHLYLKRYMKYWEWRKKTW